MRSLISGPGRCGIRLDGETTYTRSLPHNRQRASVLFAQHSNCMGALDELCRTDTDVTALMLLRCW